MFQGGGVERRKLLRCQGYAVPEAAMLNLAHLIDDAKCYESVRQMRWAEKICCPKCSTSRSSNAERMRPSPIVSDTSVKIVALTSMI